MTEADRGRAWGGASGPGIAWAFQRVFAFISALAWLSLAIQVRALIGSRGLLPIATFLDATRAELSAREFPTLFWLGAGDGLLVGGAWLGLALSIAALVGLAPRLCFALSTTLYLSYAVAGRTFLSFQWDNLLVEAGALAALLSTRQSDRAVHLLFRVLLFKLYFESGLAKALSPLGDWWDGSAMRFYYETAPLPAPLAWSFHFLPAWWHTLESWSTLVFELLVPLAFFGPRRARWGAAFVCTGFQALNAATANYGFFCWLAVALHLFLFDDRDLALALTRLQSRAPVVTRWLTPRLLRNAVPASSWRRAALAAVATLAIGAGALQAWDTFGRPGRGAQLGDALLGWLRPLRLVNTYHLFGSITRERVEVELQTTADGDRWDPQPLKYKPGPIERSLPIVAPHQPRLDFQLWFFGLEFSHRPPEYVQAWVKRACEDPEAIAGFFAGPFPLRPRAVRLAFYGYHFAPPAERARTGAIWERTFIATSRELVCSGSGG